ncbi:MAG: hypothetical protein JO337_08495 [Acidimicrobiales bacterium]|nr:hypothetical protein [Acidimicrobiales bacterium]
MRLRHLALAPTLSRLDRLDDTGGGRLDTVMRRLDEIEVLIGTFEGRVATISERQAAQTELHSRLAAQVEEIKRLLGAPVPSGES